MTDCQHPNIQTWYAVNTRKPAGMWSCTDCNIKFVPFTELMNDIAAEREACAKIIDDHERARWEETKKVFSFGGTLPGMGLAECAAAIRARGDNA